MYEVTVYWEDLQDENYAYNAGDTYPRKGLKPTAERIKELSGSANLRGIPLIREVKKKRKETQTEAES